MQNLPPAPGWPIHPALVTNAFEIPGYRLTRSLGVVRGLIVRAPGFGQGFAASIEAIGGGNQATLTQICEKARADAFFSMLQHAAQLGANAVIGMRYDATELGGQSSLTEVLAYGTAVWCEPAA